MLIVLLVLLAAILASAGVTFSIWPSVAIDDIEAVNARAAEPQSIIKNANRHFDFALGAGTFLQASSTCGR